MGLDRVLVGASLGIVDALIELAAIIGGFIVVYVVVLAVLILLHVV